MRFLLIVLVLILLGVGGVMVYAMQVAPPEQEIEVIVPNEDLSD